MRNNSSALGVTDAVRFDPRGDVGRLGSRAAAPPTQSTEVRWFLPGDGPSLDGARVRTCTDSYRCDTIADGVSVKSRAGHGAGVIFKLRHAVLPAVAIGDVRGAPESWLRWELGGSLPQAAAAVRVRKYVGRHKGVEVAHVLVQNQPWWTVALRSPTAKMPVLPTEILTHLSENLDRSFCCSYPGWLDILMRHGMVHQEWEGIRPLGAGY